MATGRVEAFAGGELEDDGINLISGEHGIEQEHNYPQMVIYPVRRGRVVYVSRYKRFVSVEEHLHSLVVFALAGLNSAYNICLELNLLRQRISECERDDRLYELGAVVVVDVDLKVDCYLHLNLLDDLVRIIIADRQVLNKSYAAKDHPGPVVERSHYAAHLSSIGHRVPVRIVCDGRDKARRRLKNDL